MGTIIAFILGVITGVIILGVTSAGAQKEKEYKAYQTGLNDAVDSTAK